MPLVKLKEYSTQDLSDARKNGFKTKKPTWGTGKKGEKKPRKYTESNYENFAASWNNFVDLVMKNAKEYRKKRDARKKGGKTISQQIKDQLRGKI